MVGAADPSGILQNPWKEVLEKQHPEVSVLVWRFQGMMGSPGGPPDSAGIKSGRGEGLEGAREREERSLEQTAGNCFSFVCCGGEGSGAEKCILLI